MCAASFTWGGEPYFTGVSDISQGCMICDQTIGAGWETYVTAVGSTQDVICRWCGRDEMKLQGGDIMKRPELDRVVKVLMQARREALLKADEMEELADSYTVEIRKLLREAGK